MESIRTGTLTCPCTRLPSLEFMGYLDVNEFHLKDFTACFLPVFDTLMS